ncbi:MAG: tetratricopeptide repeat protein [Planctomycetota bacterium]|nr:tetratricopeptide repeat protein [Planctomycetota bacterium]
MFHEQWVRLEPVLRLAGLDPCAPGSFAARLRAAHGPDADPSISLDSPPSDLGKASSDLLKRLGKKSTGSRYRLEGEVARGGMGAILRVWDEDIRRHLAMKVVLGKGEATTEGGTPAVEPEQLARFLEEAQVTGQLDHPGIVPVHELGIDKDGRVFFTMKLVKGRDLKSIYELVFEGREGWNETRALTTLLKVCEAVAYAHKKGVIHRDLKPSNVMVGDFGEVYVMDWGLARVVGRKDRHDIRIAPEGGSSKSVRTERREEREETPDSPVVTMDGTVVGTPAYMSPEQARGDPDTLDSRTDVYALGAMLYHLLTRRAPFTNPGERASNRTILARVLDGPPKPIRILRVGTAPELEAICDRAMARDSVGRYPDTLALAVDLRAFLEQRVVGAYEAGTWAETRKWVQRNKPLAAALAAVLLTALGGMIAYAVKARQAELAADEARAQKIRADFKAEEALLLASSEAAAKERALESQRAAEANAKETQVVADYLARIIQDISPELLGRSIHSLLNDAVGQSLNADREREADPEASSQALRDRMQTVDFTTVASQLLQDVVLAPAINSAANQLDEVPAVQAQLQMAVGRAQFCYGLLEEAGQTAALAAAASAERLGQTSRWTHRLNNLRVMCLVGQQNFQAAESLAHSTVNACEQNFGALDIDTLTSVNNLGFVLQSQARYTEALECFVRACDGLTSQYGGNDPQSVLATINIATTFMLLGEKTHAQSLFDQVATRTGYQHSVSEPTVRVALCNMGALLLISRRYEEAEVLFRQAIAAAEAAVGRAHPHYLLLAVNLAAALTAQGRLNEAESTISGPLDRLKSEAGLPSRLQFMAELQLGNIAAGQHRAHAAVASYQNGRPLLLEQIDTGTTIGLQTAVQYSLCMFTIGDYNGTVDLCERVLGAYRPRVSPEHNELQEAVYMLAIALRRQGRHADAEPYLREAVAFSELNVTQGKGTLTDWADIASRLADSLCVLGRFEDAAPLLHRIIEVRSAVLGPQHADTLTSVDVLGSLLVVNGRPSEAASELRRAVLEAEAATGELDANYYTVKTTLAFAIRECGQLAEAEALFRECIEYQSCAARVTPLDEVTARRGLAVCILRQGRFEQAEALLLEVDSRIRAGSSVPLDDIVLAARNTVELFDSWNRATPSAAVQANLARWKAHLDHLEGRD